MSTAAHLQLLDSSGMIQLGDASTGAAGATPEQIGKGHAKVSLMCTSHA
jgi:hypothetical protein